MKRVALVLALAACGGKSGGSASNPGTGTAGVPAPLYAALFVSGAQLRFATTHTSSHWDDQDPKADAQGNVKLTKQGTMSCIVDQVKRYPAGAIAARVTCDDDNSVPVGDSTPTGVYVATRAGLWRTADFPTDDAAITALAPADMLIAATPAPKSETKNQDEGFGEKLDIERGADGTWCVSRTSWGGDEGGTKLCFREGDGLVAGAAFWAGGSSQELSYERVR